MTASGLPIDDETRVVTLVDADAQGLDHIAIGVQTYTVLVRGAQTAGRYALIDMLVPPGAGAPPHRHDFEEAFHMLEGAIEVTIRGHTVIATQGHTINIPALAPHSWRNPGDVGFRALLLVAPAGIEEYFAGFGDPVASRAAPAPPLTAEEQAERRQRSADLGPKYGIELL
jgi:quercetin dioxygenase-like cupin family protein